MASRTGLVGHPARHANTGIAASLDHEGCEEAWFPMRATRHGLGVIDQRFVVCGG